MNQGIEINRSWHLLAEGRLPGWAGGCAFLLLGAFVLFQFRREFQAVHCPTRLKHILQLIRALTVGLMVLLLSRPVLRVVEVSHRPPQWVALIDKSRSMKVNETFGALSRTMDVLELLEEQPIKGRDHYAASLSRVLGPIGRSLGELSGNLSGQLADAATDRPLSPGLPEQIRSFAARLGEQLEEVRTLAPDAAASRVKGKLKADLARARGTQQTFLAMADALRNESEVTAKEGARHLAILQRFSRRVDEVSGSCKTLQAQTADLQDRLDAACLPPNILDEFRGHQMRRTGFAGLAAEWIRKRVPQPSRLKIAGVSSLSDALARAANSLNESPPAGFLVFSDGSKGLTARARAAAERLAAAGMPVHTILIGRDSVAPLDSGIVAVDLPPLLLVNHEVRARVRIKQLLPPGVEGRIEVLDGPAVLASYPLKSRQKANPAEAEFRTIPVPFVPGSPGLRQFTFRLQLSRPDGFPGNETQVAASAVLEQSLSVLLVGDRLENDYAAYRAALLAQPGIVLQTALGVPELSELEIGSDSGNWPGTLEQWKALDAAVLCGGIPEDLLKGKETGNRPPALKSLTEAVSRGLRVLIHERRTVAPGHSWSELLGISSRPAAPGRLSIPNGTGGAVYRLGMDPRSTRSVWDRFPEIGGQAFEAGGVLRLLDAGESAVVGLVPRGKGRVLFCGLPLDRLGHGLARPAISRFLRGLLALVLAPPLNQLAGTAGTFPSQPVAGKEFFTWPAGKWLLNRPENGEARAQRQSPSPDGWDRWQVSRLMGNNNSPALSFQLEGQNIERIVQEPVSRADFDLAPRAAPLKELAHLTGGRSYGILSLPELPGVVKSAPFESQRTLVYRLWHGWWSLFLLLFLVCTEYLLRRKAGRVM